MKITFQSEDYAATAVRARYVKRSPVTKQYYFAEVGEDTSFDIRQGTLSAKELPAAVREAADRVRSAAFGYVDWPLDDADPIGQTDKR